jgi:two-component system nitrate/nitrite response regulator NarL
MSKEATSQPDGATERVRVYVAEDHPLFLQGILQSVASRSGLELAGHATNGRDALEQITELRPHVTVLDVKMPGLEGPEVLQELRRRGVQTRVVFLSAMLDRSIVYEALAAGASGYLSKQSTPDEVWNAVEVVAQGGTVIPPEVQAGLVEHIRAREQAFEAARSRPRLTAREHEVLGLMAEGCSAPEIGRRLYLSPATVKTHMKHLYEKLGVSERAAAIAEAMRAGLLD